MWNRVRISLVVLIAVVGAMATTPPAGGATARGATPDAGSRWTSHGPGGAEVSAVAIDPRTPSTLVVTTAAGVFRTFDGGATWQGASRGLGQDDWIPQIAVAPSQPRVLYAVRGWPHPALFRSSDRAGSWRLASEKLKGKPQAVAVDPRDAHVVYAAVYATPHKLFKSIDGGRHWRASDDGIDEFASIAAFAIDPSRPATIYAAGGGIYKSVNAGASWTRLPTNGDFASIAVGHDRPNLLYAAERSSRVDVSNDGGATWHVSLDSGCRSCWSSVFIDPEAARTAYASSGRLYKTMDGGATWTPLAKLTSPVNWIAVDPSDSSHVYAGTSESQVPAFIGAGAGVYESADGGMTWAPRGRGLRATFELSVAAAPSHPGTVYAGGSSGVARSLDDGRHWVRSSGGLPDDLYVDDLAVDPTDARTVYAASGNHGLWATTDGGGSWQARNEGLPGPWIISVAAEGGPSRAVFAATLHGLYRSTDGGATWQPSGELGTSAVDELAVDPAHSGVLYAEAGNLYRSTDDGLTWTQTSLSRAFYVDAITIASDGTVYVTVSRSRFHGVRASSDEGRHWERRMGDLPNAQMLGIAVDPTDPDVVYVGSLAGVHKTTDGGQTWSLFDEGLRTRYVLSVSVDGDGGAVHVGTGGGGVFDRGIS